MADLLDLAAYRSSKAAGDPLAALRRTGTDIQKYGAALQTQMEADGRDDRRWVRCEEQEGWPR